MLSLIRSASLDAGDPVHALLSLEEADALRAAMGALEPEEAALAIGRAPTLEDRSRLIWALEPERRTAVLDYLHPGFVGALIQNQEAENRKLLGDLSREQFNRLLRYCSPEQAFYWLTLATSFAHPRANMLPLLVGIEEVAEALLTRPEFVTHCQEVGEYHVGDFQLDLPDEFLDIASATVTVSDPEGFVEEFPILDELPVRDPRLRRLLHTLEHHPEQYTAVVTVITVDGAMEEIPLRDPRLRRLLHKILDYDLAQYTALLDAFGPEGVLRNFPIRDRRLRRLLKTILDRNPEHYIALVQAALQLADYRLNHEEEREQVHEAPILLDALRTIEEERTRVGLGSASEPEDRSTPQAGAAADPFAAPADLEGSSEGRGDGAFSRPTGTGESCNAEPSTGSAGLDSAVPTGQSGPQSPGSASGSTLHAGRHGAADAAATPARPQTDREPVGGEEMTFLSRSAALDPDDPVQALLSLEEADALRAAVNALEPQEAALAVGRAPTLDDKSRLIWALEPDRRGEVLDHLHPGFVGALIQNREAENKALLGDLSREQFTRLLRYCSPERAYYWLTLATSFEDARANMLPLLVPLHELAAALLTQPEFETHCQRIGDYSVEDLGLDLGDFKEGLAYAIITLFGADGMLQAFPIKDRRLRRILQTILDHSPEHYAALIHTALEVSDYGGNHPEEREVLQEDPILLEDLLTVDEERTRAGLTPPEGPAARPKAGDARAVPSLPARQSAELMRAAAASLPVQRQSELSQELQLLFLQEAAYAGGSFAQADLEQAAERVQSYVQLGLAGLADGDPGQAARLLGEQRLRTLMESGARQIERLRQVALRLLPWHEVLDQGQLRLLQSLEHPELGIDPESDRPVLRLRRGPRGPAVDTIELEAARAELETISAWVSLVRAVGKARIARRMAGSPEEGAKPADAGKQRDAAALTRSLIVAAVMYRHWDPALVEPADIARFRETYLDPATGRFNAAAFRALAEAVRALAAERKLEPGAVEQIARLLVRALDELAGEEVQ